MTIATVVVLAIGAIFLAPRAFRAWVDWTCIDGATHAAKQEGTTVAAAIQRYRFENREMPADLRRDLVPKYTGGFTENWYLDATKPGSDLCLHSNLPEWLLRYDFTSQQWTVELIGRTINITYDVNRK